MLSCLHSMHATYDYTLVHLTGEFVLAAKIACHFKTILLIKEWKQRLHSLFTHRCAIISISSVRVVE